MWSKNRVKSPGFIRKKFSTIGLDFFLVNSNRPTGQGRLVKDHLHFSKNNYFLSKVVT